MHHLPYHCTDRGVNFKITTEEIIEILLTTQTYLLYQVLTISSLYASFKETVHPSDFENKRVTVNICLHSRLFQTGKKRAKAGTME